MSEKDKPWTWDVVAIVGSDGMAATVMACKVRNQGLAAETFIGPNIRKLQRKANRYEATVLLDEGLIRCNLYGGMKPLGSNPIATIANVMYDGIRREA